MFRTKQAVDRHVQELFRKVKDENERTLRCYNIAKLYFQVEDYESAKRYVSCYLEVKSDQAGPHKLLGKVYEALGQKESALAQYKQSLELEPRQDDLVLKVCELLVDTDPGHDGNRIKYWADRADERFPHHPTVFRLKEKYLTIADRPNGGGEDLEALIAAELSARPSDVNLRVKLLKYYVEKSRLDDAYEHALEVESTLAHRDSVAWYEALCDLLSKCKDGRQPKWSFWILYVSSLERYAALSLKEQGHVLKKTIPEAVQAVFNFDQALTEAKLQNYTSQATFAENMFAHMWGQLHFHLACLLLRKTKREQGSWSETGRLCAPLLLAALHVQPIDTTTSWATSLKDEKKSQIRLWHREASYRCSQAGHILQNYARDDVKRMMEQIDKFCIGTWRERIYQRIFVSKVHIATSYFTNHAAPDPPLRLCSGTELKVYDEVAEQAWPASLHHHVWLGIARDKSATDRNNLSDESVPRPHQYCHVFPSLQLSVFNLSQAAPDSLGQLDVDAFLNAAVLCASVVVEEQRRSGFLSPDRLPTLPADITNTLCTCTQEKWWASAYKIYRKHDAFSGDLGEIRQELQRGLEVVRCIGNHGLHPAILVHLARIFHHRTKLLKEKDKNHGDLPFIEARCELYWSAVVPLLERLLNNQTIRSTNTKIFDYQGKEMTNAELTNALEEGRLLLAQRYVREKQHEPAIEALQALKCPEASFMQGEIYKSLADELMSTLPKESLTSAMRSQHIVMLSKARGCYYLTLDRLRSPGINPKHPLNSELGSRIADIENDLKRIDPDVWRANRNECDPMSEESYSSAHSGDQAVIQNSYVGGLGSTIHVLGTPQKSAHRTPKQASTPCRAQHQDILELTRKSAQQEARPSPERLDAQIRQLIHSKDNMIQTILEQNKTLLETNKNLVESNRTINEKIVELQKQFNNFCKDFQGTKSSPSASQQTRQNRPSSVSVGQNTFEDDLRNEEDYSDPGYVHSHQLQQTPVQQPQIGGNLFGQQPRNPYPPLVYPQAAALPGYYPGAIPFTDPHAQHVPPLYGNSRVFPMHAYYPRPPMDPNLGAFPKTPENVQALFANRFVNQSTELGPQMQQQQFQPPVVPQQQPVAAPTASQLSMQLQSFDATRNEPPAKDVRVSQSSAAKEPIDSRAPPVNVVITTSDTLPTTAPSVQPPLSVTIPPRYRAVSSVGHAAAASAVTTTASSTAAPHSYQISMPSHAMIPTTVNLPPLSTSITDTISATVAEQERNQRKTASVLSTSTHNYSGEGSEIEHDPLPDFVPVIPLPAEVQVTTGEENEEQLFCARAKLYRWSDHEWKERGVGNVKLLRNQEGKVRLVMRREQVLKICANHLLKPDMELTRMMNNERAWIWVANDFADERVRLEKLCIKFKHVEEAQSFKENFDRAKASSGSSEEKVPECELLPPNNGTDSTKTDSEKSSMYGGFSFSSKPVIRETAEPEPIKSEEPTKPSPFADFTFAKSSSGNNESAPRTAGFSFVTAPPAAAPTKQVDDPSRSGLRRPHAPAPAKLAASLTLSEKLSEDGSGSSEIQGPVDDNGEALLYEEKASLMRRNPETGQWKNRGLGNVKILLDPKTGRLRISIKRDETGKTFCNYPLTGDTKFSLLPGTDNVVTWNVRESSKGKTENVACLFESGEEATRFENLVASIQRNTTNDRVPVSSLRQDGRVTRLTLSTEKKTDGKPSLAEMFKPPRGSWECGSCYTRNDSTARSCIACRAEQPNVVETAESNESLEKSSLWDRFKPQPESWECRSCYIRNGKESSYCVACDTAKDPSAPPREKSGTSFGARETCEEPPTTASFTFGLPKASATTPLSELFKPQAPGSFDTKTATSSFSFGLARSATRETNNAGFTFKMSSGDEATKVDTKNVPIFGGSKVAAPPTNFTFGIPQRPVTPPNNEPTSGFAFGSPGKSFDFQFSGKSPTKSPGERGARGDTSEDEVAESEDIYFTPVVPLPDKVEVKTGEEDEQVVYAHRAKLFRFDAAEKEWKERGLGDIKILRHSETKKLRMVMRRDQTLKICLNHAVTTDLEVKRKDEKTWLWNAADYSEGNIERLRLACRFKTAEIAETFKKSLDDALAYGKTTSEADAPPNGTNAPPVQEIQVVYEVRVTEEEKAAARKLGLPENFYAYRLRENCTGCRGCREPEVPLFQRHEDTVGSCQTGVVPKIAPPKLTLPATLETVESAQKPFSQLADSEETKKFSGLSFGPSLPDGGNIFSGTSANTQTSGGRPVLSSNSNAENSSTRAPDSNRRTTNPSEQQTATQQPFGRIQSPFGATSLTGQTWLFGAGPSPGVSIFGGNATTKSPPEPARETETSPAFPTIFGSGPKSSIFGGSNPVFGSGQPTFGAQAFGAATTNPPTPGNTIFATHTFGSSTSEAEATFDNLGSSTANDASSSDDKSTENAEEKKSEAVNFLPVDSGATFSALAAQSPTQPSFQKDPNFSFAGAGASVFGSKKSNSTKLEMTKSAAATKKSNEDGEAEEPEEDNNEDPNAEHDPHFEPIVPLPDAIEVRTGEEEEEKVFAQRAKLYRYESETKEWKERGIGEMKLLHHWKHGTYRLLLRREQVHKVVCNQLVTLDLELRPLHSSDRAWMWAAFNHAEEPYALEELAVRFKNPELAAQFKEAVDRARIDLQERRATGQGRANETSSTECYYSEDQKDDDADEDEDNDEHSVIFESRTELFACHTDSWQSLGAGVLKVVYDSNIYGAKIIVESEETGELLSNTVISMETSMATEGNSCVWRAIDEVLNPPTRRTLKALFCDPQLAQEMYINLQDGQDYAKQADISEASYYDPGIE